MGISLPRKPFEIASELDLIGLGLLGIAYQPLTFGGSVKMRPAFTRVILNG